ncbi:MAG: ThiF family adenylyltransferase [Haloarculaceae archaeon]
MQLTITATQLDRLHEWLVQDDEIERFAFLYCSERDGTLLVEAVDPVADEDCAVQGRTGIALDLESELDRLNDCLERGQVPILVHSHPFADLPGFSGQDHEMFDVYREWLGPLYPETPLGFAVVGRCGMDTTMFEQLGAASRSPLTVEVIGGWQGEVELDVPTADRSLPDVDAERFDRSIRAFDETGQARLADTHVGIVGVGGLGSMSAEQLARLGVGELTVVDPDVVEPSNLPRIYGATEHHVGRPKVDVVEQHLWRVNPDVEVTTHRARVQDVSEPALADCDVLVGAVDRVTARSYLNELAVRHLTYYLDAGVVIKTGTAEDATGDEAGDVTAELGVAQLVVPGVNGCLSCLGRRDPERARLERLSEEQVKAEIDRGYVEGDVLAPQPAVTPLNGVVAAQVGRIVGKLVTGYDDPPDMVQYRGLADESSSIGTHRDAACPVCGDDGMLGRGSRTPDVDLVGGAYGQDGPEPQESAAAGERNEEPPAGARSAAVAVDAAPDEDGGATVDADAAADADADTAHADEEPGDERDPDAAAAAAERRDSGAARPSDDGAPEAAATDGTAAPSRRPRRRESSAADDDEEANWLEEQVRRYWWWQV